ncbi:MAG TPA: outer membrane protein assembly factor BamE [Noviherbaspirillum sp.]|uniref:outer membrane protein assembly factor BamE n=1 Tax=Noviherbaspirillum sp. TaxID=1926288 RepID=UPI002D446652|nr:outer membrane protein assembly factor BamE [Noviherbaspirillum sp.]HYD97128.1 outer membrane protein assembly factor BamE [Noviherbaspirillum sp.]
MEQGKWLAGLMLGMVLAACDRQGRPVEEFGLDKLARGISSEGDVRGVMGQPETVWEEDDGTRSLQYPKGPEGARTWEFVIDKSGKLKDYRQLLTQENFARVRSGMSKDEVRRLLGKPRTVAEFKLKNEEVWDWRFQDTTEQRFFNVHFDKSSGKVTGTSSSSPHH